MPPWPGRPSTSGSIRPCCERGIAGVFEQARRGFYLIAERDGVAVGSLLVTYEWSDWRCGDFWWIQSVYVTPQARRHGVFRALYAEVGRMAAAARRGRSCGCMWRPRTSTRRRPMPGLGMQRCHYFMYESEFAAPVNGGG